MLCIGKKSVKVGATILCALSVKHANPGICLTFAPWLRYHRPTAVYYKVFDRLSVMCIFNVISHFRWVICLTILAQCSLVCSCPFGPSPSWSTGNARMPLWLITGTAWTFMKRRCEHWHRHRILQSVSRELWQVIYLFVINVWILGASEARVCRHSPCNGGKPCDWSEGAIFSRKSSSLPYVHRINGHHYNGEPGARWEAISTQTYYRYCIFVFFLIIVSSFSQLFVVMIFLVTVIIYRSIVSVMMYETGSSMLRTQAST